MWTFPVVSSIINTKYDGFQQVSKEKMLSSSIHPEINKLRYSISLLL